VGENGSRESEIYNERDTELTLGSGRERIKAEQNGSSVLLPALDWPLHCHCVQWFTFTYNIHSRNVSERSYRYILICLYVRTVIMRFFDTATLNKSQ
jgi:hypothetical protein